MKNDATIFDKLGASTALDATAGRVTARGAEWVPEAKMPPGMLHWKAPPPTKAFVADPRDRGDADLSGKKFGRFVVVGLLAEGGGKGNRWVCRCLCGDFEARKSKAIKFSIAGLGPVNDLSTMCFYCFQWQVAKERYKKNGAKPLSTFISSPVRTVEPKNPQDIIADQVERVADGRGRETGEAIIAALNRGGYRIVRDKGKATC